MKFKLALAAVAATLAMATPAMAADLGDLGSAGFSYGTLAGGAFSAYNPYASGASECLGLGACYRGGDTYAIIAASGTPGSLLVHPGPGAGGNSAVSYTVAAQGLYNLSALGTSGDFGGKDVGYFTIIGGVLTTYTAGNISTIGSSLAVGGTVLLNAGDSIGVFVTNGDGSYYNDSTLFSGTISAVPEAATWAMMLAGFGMIGFAARRRSKQTVRVTYA